VVEGQRRNKRSIALDLKDPADHALFIDLVAGADVITANFVPGTLERLGLDYDALRLINPAIVLVTVRTVGEYLCVARSSDGCWMSASKWASPSDPCDRIRQHIQAHPASELLSGPGPFGFAIAPVSAIDDLLDDRQCQARDSIVRVADDELDEVALAAVVPRFSRTPGRVAHASPKLDEHRSEIVDEWCGRPS
jgi:crotonobetainyl-CoA:carnitine CoA-transferase CaiB-like acyl-CoA transferase